MHEPHPRRTPFLAVPILAAASLAALLVARPHLGHATWSDGTDVALAAAWTVAVAASAWLFAVTGACALALGIGRPLLARRLTPALPAGIRRMVEVAIVAACVTFPALPAGAATPPTTRAPGAAEQPVVRAPIAVPKPVPKPKPKPASAPAAVRAPAIVDHVVVRAGDNLWLIARSVVTRASGSRPTDAQVAPYWRALITANRATLRSGNPSLIFPGEVVALPALSVVP